MSAPKPTVLVTHVRPGALRLAWRAMWSIATCDGDDPTWLRALARLWAVASWLRLWWFLRGLPRVVAAAALALVLLVPSAAWARRTPLTEAAISRALAAAHRDVFGEAPSSQRLLVARAQVGLEVGRGKACWCHNLGNIAARRGGCVTRGGFRVRSYASPRAAARAYWRLRSVRRALPWFDRGDAHGAALALGRAGYYTAAPEVYAARMVAVHRELSRDVVGR